MKKLSFPKSKIKVLLLEKLDKSAAEIFVKEGYDVETYDGSLNEEKLISKIKKVSILGIRSKTYISKKVIDSADRLLSIGAFCIGTNQINLNECKKAGITDWIGVHMSITLQQSILMVMKVWQPIQLRLRFLTCLQMHQC